MIVLTKFKGDPTMEEGFMELVPVRPIGTQWLLNEYTPNTNNNLMFYCIFLFYNYIILY